MITGNKIPFVKENLEMSSAIKILSNKKLGVLIVQNNQKKNYWRHKQMGKFVDFNQNKKQCLITKSC